jgi:hypothetical protein
MKRTLFMIAVLALLLTACSQAAKNSGSNITIEDILREYQQPSAEGRGPFSDGGNQDPTNGPTCYSEGQHPIAASIVDQYSAITTYDEVMTWFCNGATFEDILDALTTQELTGVEAEATLRMVAAGFSWDEIWLELGVTDE